MGWHPEAQTAATQTEAIDLGDEDVQPSPEDDAVEIGNLTPAQAARAYDAAVRGATTANRRAELAKQNKKRHEAVMKAVLEHYELASVKPQGLKVLYYTGPFRTFNVVDWARFREWEAEQDENYFEDKLRQGVLNELCAQLDDDGQELPPGVVKYEDIRLYRKADKKDD